MERGCDPEIDWETGTQEALAHRSGRFQPSFRPNTNSSGGSPVALGGLGKAPPAAVGALPVPPGREEAPEALGRESVVF